jgi:hypothetical protein
VKIIPKTNRNRRACNRRRLRRLVGEKVICKGIVDKINDYYIGLKNVNIGKYQFQHIWIKNEGFSFSKHDRLEVFAIVEKYNRKNGSIGYGLGNVSEIKVLGE